MRIGTLRNKVTVYRPQGTRDAYGDVGGYSAGETFFVAIKRDNSGLRDYGAGDQPVIAAKGMARYGVNVQIRDVLNVTAGPEEGTKWRVLAAFHPGARHTDLVLEQFTGSVT
jgi:hypothetical protein